MFQLFHLNSGAKLFQNSSNTSLQDICSTTIVKPNNAVDNFQGFQEFVNDLRRETVTKENKFFSILRKIPWLQCVLYPI